MAELQYLTLSKRIVDRLSVDDKDAVFWDRDLPGFGVRVYPSGAKVYVLQTRAFGRSKRVTVGRHGTVTADEARKQAARIIARIKAGRTSGLGRTGCRPYGRGLGGTLPAGVCGHALQARHRIPLRSHAPKAHRAGIGRALGQGSGAQAHPGVSVRTEQHAHGGEPGGGHPG